jgi:hypothetical protein
VALLSLVRGGFQIWSLQLLSSLSKNTQRIE